jgi:hypothetical protein
MAIMTKIHQKPTTIRPLSAGGIIVPAEKIKYRHKLKKHRDSIFHMVVHVLNSSRKHNDICRKKQKNICDTEFVI